MDELDQILAQVPANKRAAVEAWIQEQQAAGVPVPTIGAHLQSRYGQPIAAPSRVASDVTSVGRAPVVPNEPASVAAPVTGSRGLPPFEGYGALNALTQGYSLGSRDEMRATEEALQHGTSYGDEHVRQERARADYLRQHPALGRILEGLGIASSVLGPAEAKLGKWMLGNTPGLARRIAVPAVLGTGTGAVVGALDAPEGQRGQGAAIGGMGGGALGSVLGLAAPAFRGTRNLVGFPTQDAAERLALGDMAAAGTTIPEMRARLSGMADNEPVSFGELIGSGPRSPSTNTQRAAYQVPGPGQAATGRALGAVEGSVIDRVGRTVQDVSGIPRSNVVTRLEEMQNAIRSEAEPLYQAALSRRGVVSDRAINSIVSNPVIQARAIPAANEALALRGLPPFPERGAPTAQQLHYLKGAMDDLIDYSGPPQAGGLTARNQSALKALRGEFNTALERAVPGYRTANERVAPLIRQRERFQEGAEFAKTTPDELTANWSRWSGAERDAYREGAILSELSNLEQAGQTAGGMDRTSAVSGRFTSTAQRQKWRLVLGRDATQIQQYVERALNRSAANRNILGGSQTVSNAAGLGRIGEEASAASAAGNVARGNLFGSLKDILALGANRVQGVSPRSAQQIQELYGAGITSTPANAGAPDRAALRAALERMGLASERQGVRAGNQAAAAARLSAILAQLVGGKMTTDRYPEAP